MTHSTENAISLKDFAGLFFALLAMASIVLLLWRFSAMQEDTNAHIDHIQEVFRYTQGILISGAETDKNSRSYVLTNEPTYLALYQKSRANLIQQAAKLTAASKSEIVKKILHDKLAPSLQDFLKASDQMTVPGADKNLALQQQESSAAACRLALQQVQNEQLRRLEIRKADIFDMSSKIAVLEPVVLIIALAAIISALIAAQRVVSQDRLKIFALQLAVKQTLMAEQAASEALQIAKQSNQLKSQFMANISHEIRTPMTGILGTAELLNHQKLAAPANQYASVLLDSAQQLLLVLNDLLNFSQLERQNLKLEIQSFALRKTIIEAAEAAQVNAMARDLSVVSEIDQSVPEIIKGDEDKIRQVLSTLLSNSLKFTHEGGVQISVDCPEKDLIRVSVSDTGIGIAEADIAKVFLPFVQIDGGIRRTNGGAGLSLSIAKHLVELMSGQIGVLSAPGSGSIFWFTFKETSRNE